MSDRIDGLVDDEPEPEGPFEYFLSEGLITEIVRPIKSGKEAAVHLCRGDPGRSGARLVAAKIHRPRVHRDFRDESRYLDGRFRKITSEVRAMQRKTRVGRAFSHASWVAHEWQTLTTLHRIGADVPRPIACSDTGLLMEYIGDEDTPAPTLHQVHAEPGTARAILQRLLHNVERFLLANVVHADLSAFNVLWWDERPWIIDLPQAVDPRFNSSAYELLTRDVRNLCTWASRLEVDADAETIATDLWTRWTFADLVPGDIADPR